MKIQHAGEKYVAHGYDQPVRKKKFRLQDIIVKTVGLVDIPAVQGSEFLVVKSMDEETFEPLTEAEHAWLAYWRGFPSERVLASHLAVHEDEGALFDDLSKRLAFEQEIFNHVSTIPLLEVPEFYREMDAESRAGVQLIVKRGMQGFYDCP